MEIQKALLTRATTHSYKPDPVPKSVVEQALEAAHRAPNHKMTLPWRFILVGPRTRTELAELSCELKEKKAPLTDEGRRSVRSKILNPGLVVAVTCLKSSDPVREREDYGAVSCAIENLMLSLHGFGYGSKWTTAGFTRHDRSYRILKVDPAKEELVGFVFGGVPEKPPPPSPRPPARDFVRELS